MPSLDAQTVYALIAVAIMLLVGFPVHEFMHAFAAYKLGDNTARWQGRLTLDPRVHLDPLGAGLLALSALFGGFFIGWARPTPVNPMNLQGGRRGEAIVAVAGPLSNLVMAAVVAIVYRLIVGNADTVLGIASVQVWNTILSILFFFVSINASLFVFNLLPVPPLDGWHALLGLVSPRMNWQLRSLQARYAQFIPMIFLVLILFGGGKIIGPIVNWIRSILLGF
jgi:Zn-dependent protease